MPAKNPYYSLQHQCSELYNLGEYEARLASKME